MSFETCIVIGSLGLGVLILIAIAERLRSDIDDDLDGGAGGHAS